MASDGSLDQRRHLLGHAHVASHREGAGQRVGHTARAFGVDRAPTLRGAVVSQPLHGSVGAHQRHVSAGNERATLAFTIDTSGLRGEMPYTGLLRLGREDAEQARVLAARVALQLAPHTKVAFAFAESGEGLVAQLQGQDRPAFLIAGGATGDSGLYRTTDASFALRRQVGRWGLHEWITLTYLMGAFFIGGQIFEYAGLVHEGITISSTPFGSVFYLATGFHGLHVLGGLIAFLFLQRWIYKGLVAGAVK